MVRHRTGRRGDCNPQFEALRCGLGRRTKGAPTGGTCRQYFRRDGGAAGLSDDGAVPPSKMQSPTLHFRRLREPPPPPEIPVSTLPRREQLLVIRFVKMLHDAGFDDLGHLAESIARPIAECVVQEFFAAENEPGCDVVAQPRSPEELAPLIPSQMGAGRKLDRSMR